MIAQTPRDLYSSFILRPSSFIRRAASLPLADPNPCPLPSVPCTLAVLLAEPPRTNYDLHFRLLGIPVRVHPFFWLVALFSGAREGVTPKETFVWMVALFISIVIHEMGHAVAILYYGFRPWITLHWLGGLASHDPGYSDSYGSYAGPSTRPMTQIVISLAGPAAGFLFAGLVVALIFIAGAEVRFDLGGPYLFDWYFSDVGSRNLLYLLNDLIFINIFWGLINLLPVYPLDGGQVSRELFLLANPQRGIEWSLQLSIFAAIGMAVYAMLRFTQPIFVVMLFAFLAFASYQALMAYRGFGGRFGGFGGADRYDDDDSSRGRGW
jgi:Zn-dependent protease